MSASPAAGTADRVLFVDDEVAVRRLLGRLCRTWSIECEAVASAPEGLRRLEDDPYVYGVLLVDLNLDGGSGLDLLETAAHKVPWITRILVSGCIGVDDALDAINRARVHRAVRKPWSGPDLEDTLRKGLDRAYLGLRSAVGRRRPIEFEGRLLEVLRKLSVYADQSVPHEGVNSVRLARVARELARAHGLTDADVRSCEIGALCHNIGQVIGSDPGPDTNDTLSLHDANVNSGFAFLSDLEGMETAAEVVLQSQERFDGLGHPSGLKGAEISVGARIFRVAHGLERLTQGDSARLEDAFRALELEAGGQFDPEVIEIARAARELASAVDEPINP